MQGVEVESINADAAQDRALDLNVETHKIVLSRFGDPSTYPYLHVVLASLYHFMQVPAVLLYVQERMPFGLMAEMLNRLASACDPADEFQSAQFPGPGPKDIPRPLPEDYSMRGLIWTEKYFPEQWFFHHVDEDERGIEVPSMGQERKTRCLWLGVRIAELGRGNKGHHLDYDPSTNSFCAVNAPPKSVTISEDGETERPAVENTMSQSPKPNDPSRTSMWASKTTAEQDEDMVDSVPVLIQ